MTPCHKIMREILLRARAAGGVVPPGLTLDTDAEVAEAYADLCEKDDHQDFEAAVRGGEVRTDLPTPSSRHYEARAVAMKTADGSWVGWVFWYGGGKHGEPESMPWMEDAYDLDCVEEEKVVVVRTFRRRDAASEGGAP